MRRKLGPTFFVYSAVLLCGLVFVRTFHWLDRQQHRVRDMTPEATDIAAEREYGPVADKTDLGLPRVSDGYIHIILAADIRHFPGGPTVINSILSNTRSPQRIRIHFIVCGETKESLLEYLQCHGLEIPEGMIEIVEFDGTILGPDMKDLWEKSYFLQRLKSPCNYARAYFYRLFPHVSKAIYLDMDLVVQSPIEDLWSEAANLTAPFLAVDNHRSYIHEEFDVDAVAELYEQRYNRPFNKTVNIFNCGVFVMDLDYYRRHNLVQDVEFWLKLNAERPADAKLWLWDAQAILQILYQGRWQVLERRWNVEYLGAPAVEMNESRRKRIGKAGIIHWTGEGKPFLPTGINTEYWLPYQPDQCSGRGRCVHTSPRYRETHEEIWICECQKPFSGRFCDKE